MISFEFGDVLLLSAFPYSNLGTSKKRPALLLADTGDRDIVVARITSESSRDAYDLEIDDWKTAGLLVPSVIRCSKVATVSRGTVIKKLGRLGSPSRRKIRSVLKKLFDLASSSHAP